MADPARFAPYSSTAGESQAEAEASLLDANRIWSMTQGDTARQRAECIDALIKLYTAWDKADPGKGHDASAQHWRAAIPATHPSTLPATTHRAGADALAGFGCPRPPTVDALAARRSTRC